jgi:hypothetical protein
VQVRPNNPRTRESRARLQPLRRAAELLLASKLEWRTIARGPLGLAQSSRIERLMGLLGGATRTSPCCIVTYRKPCGEQLGRKPISYGLRSPHPQDGTRPALTPLPAYAAGSSSPHAGGRPGVPSLTGHRLPANKIPLSSRKRPQRVHQRIGYSAPLLVRTRSELLALMEQNPDSGHDRLHGQLSWR